MNKKRLLYAVSAIFLSAFVVFVCFWNIRHKTDLSRALPTDASAVGRVDVVRLVSTDNPLKRVLGMLLPLEEEKENGLDVSQDAYIYAYKSWYGVLLPLKDEDAFFRFLSIDDTQVQHQRGMKWTVFHNNILICSDGEKANLLGPIVPEDQELLRTLVYQWMTQSPSSDQHALLGFLSTHEAPLTIAFSADCLPKQCHHWLAGFLPSRTKINDILLIADAFPSVKGLSLHVEVQGREQRVSQYLNTLEEALLPIESDVQTDLSDFWLDAKFGLDGGKVLSILRKNQQLRAKLLGLNMFMDMDMVLRSIHGTLSLSLPKKTDHIFSSFVLCADVEDDSFMSNVTAWNEGVSKDAGVRFVPFKKEVYLCTYKDLHYYFGIRDKQLFVTNDVYHIPFRSGKISQVDCTKTKFRAKIDLSEFLGSYVKELPFEPIALVSMNKICHWEIVLGKK